MPQLKCLDRQISRLRRSIAAEPRKQQHLRVVLNKMTQKRNQVAWLGLDSISEPMQQACSSTAELTAIEDTCAIASTRDTSPVSSFAAAAKSPTPTILHVETAAWDAAAADDPFHADWPHWSRAAS